MICPLCHCDMSDDSIITCRDNMDFLLNNGGVVGALVFGASPLDPQTDRCPYCNVVRGGNHHLGCEFERCPSCGDTLIRCECDQNAIEAYKESQTHTKTKKLDILEDCDILNTTVSTLRADNLDGEPEQRLLYDVFFGQPKTTKQQSHVVNIDSLFDKTEVDKNDVVLPVLPISSNPVLENQIISCFAQMLIELDEMSLYQDVLDKKQRAMSQGNLSEQERLVFDTAIRDCGVWSQGDVSGIIWLYFMMYGDYHHARNYVHSLVYLSRCLPKAHIIDWAKAMLSRSYKEGLDDGK